MTLRRLVIGALAALCALLSPLAHANTTTANLGLNKPAVGGDSDNWGTYLNANADALDGEFAVVAKGDAPYTILSTDRVVRLTTAFTAGRTFTLPAAAALKASQPIVIVDAAGAISSTNPLTIARAGSDTIDGGTSFSLTSPYSVVVLRSDGVSAWTVAGAPLTGTWTPTITFAAPGSLSVSYTMQIGTYIRTGNLVHLEFVLNFTPTLGTASGTFEIKGLPFGIAGDAVGSHPTAGGTIIDISTAWGWTGYTHVALGAAASDALGIHASGPGASLLIFTTSNMTTGVAHVIRGTIDYMAN